MVRDYLELPIAVENVSSYTEFHVSEMTEWEFLSEVVERADCGILLDVNNIYVSSKNHSFDPYDYINNVPHHRVAQMHIAGHTKFEKYILDTHDHPVLDPVWQLYAHAIRQCGVTATLLESLRSIGEDVGRFGHEVHATKSDGAAITAVGCHAAQLVAVAAQIGQRNHLVLLIMVSQDQQTFAKLFAHGLNPRTQFVVFQRLVRLQCKAGGIPRIERHAHQRWACSKRESDTN